MCSPPFCYQFDSGNRRSYSSHNTRQSQSIAPLVCTHEQRESCSAGSGCCSRMNAHAVGQSMTTFALNAGNMHALDQSRDAAQLRDGRTPSVDQPP